MSQPESGLPRPDLESLLAVPTPEPGDDWVHGSPTGEAATARSGADRRNDSALDDSRASGSDSPTDVGSLEMVPVDSIVPNELQPRRRFDEEGMAALTDSVRSLGVLQPILVRPLDDHRFELIAGERRWRAARRAGLENIPAVVRLVADQRSLEEAIVENLHREDLNAIEEAAAFQQLIEDFGLTQDEVAVRVGKSRAAVSNTLRLFRLPGSVQRMVVSGELGAGHARALLGLDSSHRQRDMAERVVAESLTVRQVEDLVKRECITGDLASLSGAAGSGRVGGPGKKSAAALEVEQALADYLATGVSVEEASGTGRIVVRFADEDDLARIYELLSARPGR